jgi:hypothetical protein
VREAWRADRQKGCEHEYQVQLEGAGARGRFEALAKTLGVTPSTRGDRFRLYADAPREGLPFFVLLEPVGVETIFVNVMRPGVDVATCMRVAIDALPPSLRVTNDLVSSGAQPRYVSIEREEGTRPSCHADFEWFVDKSIAPKVRAWIERRGHTIDETNTFAWDGGGEGFVTDWSASFYTARKTGAK